MIAYANGLLCNPDATMLLSDLLTPCKGFVELLSYFPCSVCVLFPGQLYDTPGNPQQQLRSSLLSRGQTLASLVCVFSFLW